MAENFNANCLDILHEHFVKVENGHWTADTAYNEFVRLHRGATLFITSNPRAKKRKVVRLLNEGMSIEEIAKNLKCSISGVYKIAKDAGR